jgi:glutamate N-acetyltransferase/amino-acid N-acetyltransferase
MIINSPLVKTAIYGGDPNWGRLVMAVGKAFDDPVPVDSFDILFNGISLKNADDSALKFLSDYLKNKKINITVILGTGNSMETMWGCDLTEEYIHINAHYTT